MSDNFEFEEKEAFNSQEDELQAQELYGRSPGLEGITVAKLMQVRATMQRLESTRMTVVMTPQGMLYPTDLSQNFGVQWPASTWKASNSEFEWKSK